MNFAIKIPNSFVGGIDSRELKKNFNKIKEDKLNDDNK